MSLQVLQHHLLRSTMKLKLEMTMSSLYVSSILNSCLWPLNGFCLSWESRAYEGTDCHSHKEEVVVKVKIKSPLSKLSSWWQHEDQLHVAFLARIFKWLGWYSSRILLWFPRHRYPGGVPSKYLSGSTLLSYFEISQLWLSGSGYMQIYMWEYSLLMCLF